MRLKYKIINIRSEKNHLPKNGLLSKKLGDEHFMRGPFKRNENEKKILYEIVISAELTIKALYIQPQA
jgi:hypothetical protein